VKWEIAQQLEHRWWKRYTEKKNPNAYLKWKSNYWKDLLSTVSTIFSIKSGSRILDVGAGPAGIYMVLNECDVTAVDPLFSAYEQLNIFSKQQYPNVHFHQSAVEAFTSKNVFDTACCINAINHFQSPEIALKVIYHNLIDGGKLLLTCDVHRHQLLKPFFRMFSFDALHPHQYDVDDLEQLFINTGFEILHLQQLKQGHIFNYHVWVLQKA
jgi:2-polyprenyl-3-methyl-5-hydroxy-6-metoxy-1,4-benzoquinol methylase